MEQYIPINDLSDFLKTEPGYWEFEGLDDQERESAYDTLRGIRYVEKEGRDYAEYSGAEETLGPEFAIELRQPWHYEAERRFSEFLEQYVMVWGHGHHVVIRRRGDSQSQTDGVEHAALIGNGTSVGKPERTIRIYSLGEHGFIGLSWTTDRGKAKMKWDIFWGKSVASQEERNRIKAGEYEQRYRQLTQRTVGAETPEETAERAKTTLEPAPFSRGRLNIHDLFLPGGFLEAAEGIDTTRLDGFEDDGVGYKDIAERHLSSYCQPMPEQRTFLNDAATVEGVGTGTGYAGILPRGEPRCQP